MKVLGLVLLLITGITLILGFFYGVYQWFVAATLMFSIRKHYRPEIDPWSWRTDFNPFNGLVMVGWLTPEGQQVAKRFWIATGKFVLCVLIPFAMAYLTEQITGHEIILR